MTITAAFLGEEKIIDLVRRQFPTGKGVIRGIGDDCAVLRVPGDPRQAMLVTADMLIEGKHFVLGRGVRAEAIGHKALAVSLSDIAAMGGVPKYALVSLGLSGKTPASFVKGMVCGMSRLARRFGITVIGGDTNESARFVVDVTVIGYQRTERVVCRHTARPGDQVMVTGRLGGSIRGRHLCFTPRIREGLFLSSRFLPHAMIDLSDGLSLDAARIARASGVGMILTAEQIPRAAAAGSLEHALHDGEDFELLFTIGPARAARLLGAWHRYFRTPLHRIGEVISGGGVFLKQGSRVRPLTAAGFLHFSRRKSVV